jgi:hypothetical protein
MPDRKLAASSLGIDWLLPNPTTPHSVPPRSQNFYGSARSPHFVDKLTRMQRRYEEAFGGPGAVVYKLGHSEALAKVRSHPRTPPGPRALLRLMCFCCIPSFPCSDRRCRRCWCWTAGPSW